MPLFGADGAGFGAVHELGERFHEVPGPFAVRKVAHAFEDLEPAARDRFVRRVRLGDRDDAVVVAPHDQRRKRRRQIQAIAGADTLPRHIDD